MITKQIYLIGVALAFVVATLEWIFVFKKRSLNNWECGGFFFRIIAGPFLLPWHLVLLILWFAFVKKDCE